MPKCYWLLITGHRMTFQMFRNSWLKNITDKFSSIYIFQRAKNRTQIENKIKLLPWFGCFYYIKCIVKGLLSFKHNMQCVDFPDLNSCVLYFLYLYLSSSQKSKTWTQIRHKIQFNTSLMCDIIFLFIFFFLPFFLYLFVFLLPWCLCKINFLFIPAPVRQIRLNLAEDEAKEM